MVRAGRVQHVHRCLVEAGIVERADALPSHRIQESS
jgi:hypothetical protein